MANLGKIFSARQVVVRFFAEIEAAEDMDAVKTVAIKSVTKIRLAAMELAKVSTKIKPQTEKQEYALQVIGNMLASEHDALFDVPAMAKVASMPIDIVVKGETMPLIGASILALPEAEKKAEKKAENKPATENN